MSNEVRDEVLRILRLYAQTAKSDLGEAVRIASRDALFLERLEKELRITLPETRIFRVLAYIEKYVPRLGALDVMILLSKIPREVLEKSDIDPRKLLRLK